MLSAQYLLTPLFECTSIKFLFLWPPLKKGDILLCTCRSVSLLIICKPSNVCSIFFYHSARKLPNLVQWMPLDSRCSLLIFWLHFQRWRSNCWSLCYYEIALWVTISRSNYWFLFQHCLFNMLKNICLIITCTELGTVVATREWIIHWIYMQRFWILHHGSFMFLKHFLF